MEVLNRKIVDSIYDLMDVISLELLADSNDYTKNCFSVFDHWLNEEEYCEQMLSYQGVIEEGIASTSEKEKYYKFENTMMSFYVDLYNKTKVYGFLTSEVGSGCAVVFDSIEEYKSHVLLSIREQLFLKIVLPEYHSVIMGNFDLTHLLYTMKSKPESLSKISNIITSNGLFIL